MSIDEFFELPAASEEIHTQANTAPAQTIPTEREWFDLFSGIAASLKTTADTLRIEKDAEDQLNGMLKALDGEFGDLMELTGKKS